MLLLTNRHQPLVSMSGDHKWLTSLNLCFLISVIFLPGPEIHTRSHPDFDTYLFYYLAYSPFSFL